MASKPAQLHFLLIPFLAPGHFIPMVDISKLLARRGVTVTIVTTPRNAIRYGPSLDQSIKAGLPIQFLHLPFQSVEVGLPEGCESVDALPSSESARNFQVAVNLMQDSLEKCFEAIDPSPCCIIRDKYMAWAADTANKFSIPNILFDGMSCFNELCTHNLHISKVYESVPATEAFVVPGLPDRIEFTRAQLPTVFNPSSVHMADARERERKAELRAYGVVINTFEELEQQYVEEYKKVRGGNVWCIGPLALCNIDDTEKARRGNNASNTDQQCLKWLDSQESGSVIYVCFGSVSQVNSEQLKEIGLCLEISKRPFIWIIRAGNGTNEIEKWIVEHRFEERTRGRGLLFREWFPQLLILSHPAIGGFLTHCGWNSVLEAVCAGVPMITWPQFAEQFFNEKVVVQVLEIGVSVGAKGVVYWGEEEKFGVRVKSEELEKAIEKVMDGGEEGEARRTRAKELGKKANKAIGEGGSSHLNLNLLIQNIMKLTNDRNSKAKTVSPTV